MKRFFSVILGVVTLLMSILGALPVSAQNNLTCTAYALNNNTVAVDGEIDPVWQNAYSYDLGYLKKNYTYKNIANLADVGVKLLWDNNKTLYILVEIADSTRYTEQSGTAWWENDSFELWLYINGVAKALYRKRRLYDRPIHPLGKRTFRHHSRAGSMSVDGNSPPVAFHPQTSAPSFRLQ